MSYLGEFRANWRAVATTVCGLGSGIALNVYTGSLFAPQLLAAFGWSKAQFALIGVTGLAGMIFVPFAGRLADVLGVRRTAAIGVFGVPLCFLAFSAMTGDIRQLFAIHVLQIILGTATTPAVLSRPIAERFERARGLALAIGISGSPLVGAIVAPVLDGIIATEGWRAGYRAVALLSLGLGLLALILVPESLRPARVEGARKPRAAQDYGLILRSWPFWAILAAMVLCNLPQSLPHSQMKLVLLEDGLTGAAAAKIISLYALGVIFGRFVCGLALDRFPAQVVAAVAMALPSLGFLVLASSLNHPMALAASVLLIGLSQGAEGDLAAYLIVREFGIKVYGSVLGLVFGAIGLAGALGSAMLSVTLQLSDSFTPFLLICAATVAAGAALLLLLRQPNPMPAQMDLEAAA